MNNYLIKMSLIIAFISSPCFADDIRANDCPAVSAIIAAGVKSAENDPKYPTVWTASNASDHFGTKYNWLFEIEFFTAQTEAEAIAQGNAALSSLVFNNVDMFYCLYLGEYDGGEITARAMKIAG